MKKRLSILLCIISFSVFQAKGETDTLLYAKKEILSVQPVSYDAATYENFKKQKYYNYYEVNVEKPSLNQRLREMFNRWLMRNMNKTIGTNTFDAILWIIGIIVIIVLFIIVYINNPGIFYANKKTTLTYTIENEDFESQNFDLLREKSVKERNYSNAIRWQYLKILKVLHEKELISYDANKTVNEYAHEIKDLDLRKLFKNLSRAFVYYRYGKGIADETQFSDFFALSEIVLKTGER